MLIDTFCSHRHTCIIAVYRLFSTCIVGYHCMYIYQHFIILHPCIGNLQSFSCAVLSRTLIIFSQYFISDFLHKIVLTPQVAIFLYFNVTNKKASNLRHQLYLLRMQGCFRQLMIKLSNIIFPFTLIQSITVTELLYDTEGASRLCHSSRCVQTN